MVMIPYKYARSFSSRTSCDDEDDDHDGTRRGEPVKWLLIPHKYGRILFCNIFCTLYRSFHVYRIVA